MTLLVGVSVEHEDALGAAGRPAPAPIRVVGMIDTGAEMTAIPTRVAAQLRIGAKGRAEMAGYTGDIEVHPTFDVRLFTEEGGTHVSVRAIGVDDAESGPFQALVGRDVLGQCVFHYDGTRGTVLLEIRTA